MQRIAQNDVPTVLARASRGDGGHGAAGRSELGL